MAQMRCGERGRYEVASDPDEAGGFGRGAVLDDSAVKLGLIAGYFSVGMVMRDRWRGRWMMVTGRPGASQRLSRVRVRGPKSEVGGPRSEVRRPKSEGRGRRAEVKRERKWQPQAKA